MDQWNVEMVVEYVDDLFVFVKLYQVMIDIDVGQLVVDCFMDENGSDG